MIQYDDPREMGRGFNNYNKGSGNDDEIIISKTNMLK